MMPGMRDLPVITPFALLFLAVCGPESGGTETGSSTTGSATSSTADASSSATGVPTTGAPEGEGFGFACVELNPAESEDSDPFVGTAEIRLTLKYEECLVDYYTAKHPEQALTGPAGTATFSAWVPRLCTEPVTDPLVACEIEGLSAFEQVLIDNGQQSVYQMTITYTITDASQINGRTLLWGPGPLESIAECEDTTRPFVRMTLISDVIGLGAKGETLWAVSSFANPTGLMQLSTAGCIEADITRVQGA